MATRWLGMMLLSLVVVGCGGPPKGTGIVEGRVTYKGQPVLNAQVELYAAQLGAGALVETDAQGTFSVSSPIPVGIYQAGVGLIPSFPGEAPDPNKKLSPDLPKKFRNLETSGLTVTVAETQNNLLLDLVD